MDNDNPFALSGVNPATFSTNNGTTWTVLAQPIGSFDPHTVPVHCRRNSLSIGEYDVGDGFAQRATYTAHTLGLSSLALGSRLGSRWSMF